MTPDVTRHLVGRVALAVVLLWFGESELTDPHSWVGYIPTFLPHLLPPVWMILIHGWVLFVLGGLVLLGLFTRQVAWLSVLVLLSILMSVIGPGGDSSLFIRDLGLLGLGIIVALDPTRVLSWDAYEAARLDKKVKVTPVRGKKPRAATRS